MRKLVVGLGALVALTSCTSNTTGGVIDWIDFVKWNGVTYVAVPRLGADLPAAALGEQIGTVKKKVADVVNDTRYQTQDGDAAFLPIGTAIYALKDYRASFRVAVQTAKIVVYEADTDPHASVGADLIDLSGKVTSIDVTTDAGVTRTIGDPATVNRLVELVLDSPVNQSVQPTESASETITFHFRDGTQSARAFWPSPPLLERGIIVPQEFVQIVTNPLR